MALKLGIVAGEASGDNLAADLIRVLRQHEPDLQVFGIAGPRMIEQGCEPWERAESLAVMGLFEILRHLPRLFGIRNRIRDRMLAERPDVFVGVDAPEFNLNLAPALHAAGIPTVQYVSPSVWAWRQGRVHKMVRVLDLVLCLLPFEKRFYDGKGLAAEFVGHPLADQLPLQPDRAAARVALGLPADAEVVALLPGSRRGEVGRLGTDFAAAARWLAQRRPGVRFVAPMANATARELFAAALAAEAPGLAVQLVDGQAATAMTAADAVLVASGTATLEALLCQRPMVVAYRLGALTAWVLKHTSILKIRHFSQPNLLSGEALVPEFFQEAATGPALGAALERWLDDRAASAALVERFAAIHRDLRRDASARAAQAVLALVRR